jgi:hypothetical protein
MHTVKSLKAKKTHIVFSYNKENFKKKCVLACILALITSLLKSRELGQYFKKIQKKYILFCFNVQDCEFIRKTYSRYSKESSFIDIRMVRLYPIR